MSTDTGAQSSSKSSQPSKQSWNCVCCSINNAAGQDAEKVSTDAIAYGIIESILTPNLSNPSPLDHLRTDDRFTGFINDNVGALTDCITTLSRLDRRVLYDHKILDLFQDESFENDKSKDYYKDDLKTFQSKAQHAKDVFDRAKEEFEMAK
jgi:hypothetical protein